MCRSMVDIQSATAEIRRGKNKERRKKKKQDKNIISASATHGGHKYCRIYHDLVTSPVGAVVKYCDEYVCVSVCVCLCLSVREHISGTTRAIFTSFSVHVSYGRGSVLLQQGDEIRRGRSSYGGFLLH